MADMTPKENFMAVATGKIPQSILCYNMGMRSPAGNEPTRMIGPNLFQDTSHGPNGGKDIWGVTYVTNEETGYASIPEPNHFILDDITRWRDVVKAPEIPDVDWEAMAKAGYEKAEINRDTSAVMCSAGLMPFQQLIAFMGFTEGLCALYEEPEEVKALLEYLCDFYMPIIENTLDYYKPDVFYMLDDTASKYNPFFSKAIYEDIFNPIYHRMAKPAIDRGLPIVFHNCGRCEDFLDYMVDFGVKMWDPAQTENNLDAVKKKYGRNLGIVGGWEPGMFANWPNVPDDVIAESVRSTIDRYAADGGYMFICGILARPGDTESARLRTLVRSVASEYGKNYYEKH